MKQLLTQLSVTTALLLSFSFHCLGADTYTLKYNLEKGKTYKQHNVSDMNMKMNVMGQDMNMDMKMVIDVNYEVLDRSAGIYDIRMTYRKVKMDINSQSNFSFDSDASEGSSDSNVAEALKSFVGIPIDIQLTQQGKVTSVKGVDKLVEKMEAIGNPQLKQMFSQQFSEGTIQRMVEQVSAYFPDKPVAVNDSWDVTANISANGIDIISKMALTLKQVTDNIATIDIKGTVATPEGGVVTTLQGMDAKVAVNGTQAGTVQMDLNTGWFVRSEITQKFAQDIEIMGQTMPQQVEVRTTLTAE